MTKFVALPVLLLLAACGQEPAPAPQPTAAAAAAPSPTQGLPAPDQELFTRVFAEACPDAEPVSTAVCKRAGLGSSEVICEYGLGDDKFLRNSATLTAGDGRWNLADPAKVCTADAAQAS